MSKKTKRLEKENDNHKRKHERMNQNIVKMAEERTKLLNEVDAAKKRETKLSGIIKQMQQQGRGIPQGLAGTVENGHAGGEGEANGDDSEYDEEDEYDEEAEEGELSEDGEEYDEETEDELQQQAKLMKERLAGQPYHPEPSTAAPMASTDGAHQ